MATLKAIRKRISTTKSTQKITRAMKMVAGARLARAQARIVALRPYALKTQEILAALAAHGGDETEEGALEKQPDHPFLAARPEQNVALLVLTGDRGLCGAFNTNINKAAERAWREHSAAGRQVQLFTVGRKGRDFLKRRQAPCAADFPLAGELNLDKARLISRTMVPPLVKGEIDSIYLVYNEFKSAMTQRVVVERLLPLRRPEHAAPAAPNATAGNGGAHIEYIFEPDKRALLDRLVPMYVEISILRALLESTASELGARMTAMDSATKNAKEMIDSLTLAYNRARQAAITKELMEIIGGAEALKE
ncbi:MAG TPA: ATP synthase F1 subunit gamma [Polyangiaceae bacterium]|jgi:F-type H+-transporting ATPase subunit gamma|nr:ATP synthase F1 subunit gamma [Polyangiaceae bacterium]